MAVTRFTRRNLLKAGLVAGGSAIVGPYIFTPTARGGGLDPDAEALVRAVEPRTPLNRFRLFKPFTESLPNPNDPKLVLKSVPRFSFGPTQPTVDVNDPELAPFGPRGRPKLYQVTVRRGTAQIIRGIDTVIFGYNGRYPGPTFKAKLGEPVIVRFINMLDDALLSTHQHGGFTQACSDGYPTNFILPVGLTRPELVSPPFINDELLPQECPVRPFLPEEFAQEVEELLALECPLGTHEGFKDYLYPSLIPSGHVEDIPTTMWYHDHALDMTAVNTYHGLAGFYLFTDPLEQDLIRSHKLPADQFDIPLVIQDRILDANGQLFFDCLNHDGFLGDLFLVNGKFQPVLKVQRRKYRFRLLNGSPARVFEFVFTPEDRMMPVLQIGNDSWLLPRAVPRDSLLLAPAERHDVIVDFTNAPSEVFMRNILRQDDGRGPAGKRAERVTIRPGFPILKFVVDSGPAPKPADATIRAGDGLRPHLPIAADPRGIARTRVFVFERNGGAWTVNGRQFDPRRNDTPGLVVGDHERWILKNQGGGWWHPIHIHLSHHEIELIDGKRPEEHERFKKDTTILAGNTVAQIALESLEFHGPYSSHCHNIQHEDHRMMINLNPTADGGDGLLTGLA